MQYFTVPLIFPLKSAGITMRMKKADRISEKQYLENCLLLSIFCCLRGSTYGYVYVAQIAMGADHAQTLKAIREAEAWHGPSIVSLTLPVSTTV